MAKLEQWLRSWLWTTWWGTGTSGRLCSKLMTTLLFSLKKCPFWHGLSLLRSFSVSDVWLTAPRWATWWPTPWWWPTWILLLFLLFLCLFRRLRLLICIIWRTHWTTKSQPLGLFVWKCNGNFYWGSSEFPITPPARTRNVSIAWLPPTPTPSKLSISAQTTQSLLRL